MPTPSIQTLRNDAQEVLNLDSISAVRSVVAATLANANAGTPLNPNLTTQQLWNEFYQIVTQPKSDIESIIANQLMKFLFAPPAPGGVGADGQVIFNDGGVLAGDPQFLWNKTTNLLTVTGSATITGALTVDTTTLVVNAAGYADRVGIGTATPARPLDIVGSFQSSAGWALVGSPAGLGGATRYIGGAGGTDSWYFNALTGGNHIWAFGESTAMTLNATGLGVGVVPSALSGFGSTFRQKGVGSAGGIFTENSTGASWFGIYSGTSLADSAALIYPSGGTLRFGTTTGVGVGGFATQMTLDASGNLLVGRATLFAQPSRFTVESNSQTTSICGIFNDARTDSASAINIAFYRNGIKVGSVDCTNAATSYVTSSDYRLKEDVQPLSGGLARVSALKPSIYKWKINGSNGEGFIAHELAEVVPLAVTGVKDAVNEDGTVNPQGVDLSKVVPILVAAIQELTARVQTLETR